MPANHQKDASFSSGNDTALNNSDINDDENTEQSTNEQQESVDASSKSAAPAKKNTIPAELMASNDDDSPDEQSRNVGMSYKLASSTLDMIAPISLSSTTESQEKSGDENASNDDGEREIYAPTRAKENNNFTPFYLKPKSMQLQDETIIVSANKELGQKILSQLPNQQGAVAMLNQVKDTLVANEDFLDVYEASIVHNKVLSEASKLRMQEESRLADAVDPIQGPLDTHEMTMAMLKGAIKFEGVVQSENGPVYNYSIDVGKVYENIYGAVAPAALALSLFMRHYGADETKKLLSLPRGERLATLYDKTKELYIKGSPLLPITTEHYHDPSIAGKERQNKHIVIFQGKALTDDELKRYSNGKIAKFQIRGRADQNDRVYFREAVSANEIQGSPLAYNSLNGSSKAGTNIVSNVGGNYYQRKFVVEDIADLARKNNYESGYTGGGIPEKRNAEGELISEPMEESEFVLDLLNNSPNSLDGLVHELMHILNPMSKDGYQPSSAGVTRTPGLSDELYYSTLNETMGALALLNMYSYWKYQRIVTNADDLVAVYNADYQPNSTSDNIGKQRNSLPTQLRRIYNMMNYVLAPESLQNDEKDGSNGYSKQKFLNYINDNYLMIQLSENRHSNKTGYSLS